VCATALPLRALWRFARLEQSKVPLFGFLNPQTDLLSKRVGIACPGCLTKLEITQTRIRIVRASSWGLLLICCAFLGAWNRQTHFVSNQWLMIGAVCAVVAAFFWLQSLLTPYLAQVRHAQEAEVLIYPLKSAYEEPAKPE
jgi:hypothetical protein